MRLTYFGGPAWDGGPLPVRGRGQEALLCRLAVDAGTAVGYRALAEDVWPVDGPADPRASLHSLVSRLRRALPGVIEPASGGYRLALDRDEVDLTAFGDLVARARAERSAALARTALELWRGDPWLPDGFDWMLRDLLEDRAHAQRLVAAGDSGDLGVAEPGGVGPDPAPTAASVTTGPPRAALTTLVGRAAELDAVAAQLQAERLVTLVGPGGAGKTTLALESARRRPGAIVVELAPVADGGVWTAVAAAAGSGMRVTDASTQTPADARRRALEAVDGRAMLLVLDNCEHLSAEAAGVALELLRAAPGLRLLATSREPLGVPGEAFVDLGPLPESDAVELFERRVRAATGRVPEAADAETVARIVRRLDGLPLALELAAAKARTLTLAEIDAGLDHRFDLLATGPRAADPRHQTLRALIDWSWETLTDEEREALLVVSVFPDGVSAADAAVVGAHGGVTPAAFDLLVDRSLLRRAGGRFRMLETVRAYGLDRLRVRGDQAALLARQARAMADVALPRDALLRTPRVRESLDWFDANDENLSAALRTAASDPALARVGVDLVRAQLWVWMMRERFDDLAPALARFDTAALDGEAGVVVRGTGLLARTLLAARTPGDAPLPIPTTAEFAAEAEAIIDASQRHPSELTAALPALLRGAGRTLAHLVDGKSWSTTLEIDDPDPSAPTWTVALLALLRAASAQNDGDVGGLGTHSARALRLFRDVGDVWGIAFASQMQSEWLLVTGRAEEALAVADAATDGLLGLVSLTDMVQQRTLAVSALVRLGRLEEARARLEQIVALAESDGSERATAQARGALAELLLAVGDADGALRLLESITDAWGFDQLTAWRNGLLSRALVAAGRPGDAAPVLHEGLTAALRSEDRPVIAASALALADWLVAAGRLGDARSAVAASIVLRGWFDAGDPLMVRLRGRLDPEPGAAPEELSPDAALGELARLGAQLR